MQGSSKQHIKVSLRDTWRKRIQRLKWMMSAQSEKNKTVIESKKQKQKHKLLDAVASQTNHPSLPNPGLPRLSISQTAIIPIFDLAPGQ